MLACRDVSSAYRNLLLRWTVKPPCRFLVVIGFPDQIAARLDSLRRASFDVSEGSDSPSSGSPSQFEASGGDGFQQSSDAGDSRPDMGEMKTLATAAREFLSRRCASCLATGDRICRDAERLVEAAVGGESIEGCP